MILNILQGTFAVSGFLGEAFASRFVLNLTFVAQFTLLVLALNFHMKALRNLYNTFWSLTAVLLVYYLLSFTRNLLVLDHTLNAACYGVAVICLMVGVWQISSPLYYPLVQWWEYDFRFRPDIRGWVVDGEERYRARLTDLRRGAGCVTMFHMAPVGGILDIETDALHVRFNLKAEVVSRKEHIVGRGYQYGVRFQVEDLEQKQRLKLLTNFWNESKRLKIRSKFDALR